MSAREKQWHVGDITAEDRDPQSLRSKILSRVVELSEADFAVWMTVHDVNGRLFYSPYQCEGDSEARRMWRHVPGQPAAEPIQTGVRRPSVEERETFQTVAKRAKLAGYDDPMDYSACRDFYEPHGIGDEARMLAFRGRKFVGWIGIFRWQDRPHFAPQEIARLDQTTDWVKAGLTAADHLEHLECLGEEANSLFLVMSEDARIVHASEGARLWATSRRLEDLRDLLVERRRTPSGPLVVFHGMELRITLLDGPAQGVHYLIHLVPAPVPSMAPDSLLTPTQRVVAEFALNGATVNEIARAMDRSPNTVKHHLKNIYERLDVGCRVELAAALSDGAPSGH